jgi:sarcosine oxidase, subunit alpha
MCTEEGILFDDGVGVRLGIDRFYLTATTGNADAVYQWLELWKTSWRLNATVLNQTSALAAMNLAGPRAREVLGRLCQLDLSATAFPYLGLREGKVAGVPCRLLRIGFVGELGYEIHCATAHAWHLWEALVRAGQDFGLRPFGVEAQRILRLEKGHLIIGQDTDALTNPFEVNLEWALGKNKPFFVGQRSLAIVKAQTLTRRLVGIAFPPDHTGPLPEECHLVVAGKEVVGRVTSIARRSTLGRPLGLAFVRPDLASPGQRITIRVSEGRLVTAEVVALPFYDPENQRQQ